MAASPVSALWTQRELIADQLRRTGRCEAHDMLMRHGITRTAARIAELRREGWDIRTLPLLVGRMAVYELASPRQLDAGL